MENYRKFHSAQVEFPDGIIGIMGPNGAGKSTLIEAISWVLYGNSSVDRTVKEGIKRAGAGPNEDCSVTIIFELGGVEYQVKRSMRGKNLKVDAELLGNGEVLASSERSVTSFVEKILGMDYRSFFHSVFARQRELSALSALTPADRKKLIVRMLDLDILQDVINDIRQDERDEKRDLQFINEQLLTPERRPKREVLNEEREKLEAELSALEQQLEAANLESRRLEEEWKKAKGHKEWTALKEEEYRKHDRRLSEKRKELEGLQQQRGILEKDLSALRIRLEALPDLEKKKEEYDELLRQRDAMEVGLRSHEERKSIRASLQRNEEGINRLERAIEESVNELTDLRNPQESLGTVTQNLAKIEEDIAAGLDQRSTIDYEVQSLRREIKDLSQKRAEVNELGAEGICPTCERVLGDHHRHLLNKLDEQNSNRATLLKSREEELGILEERLGVEQRRQKILEERKEKLQVEVKRVEWLDASLHDSKSELEELVERKKQLEDRLSALGDDDFDERTFANIKNRISDLRADVNEFQALSGESSRLPNLESRQKELESGIEKRERELQSIQAELTAVGYQEGDYRKALDMYEKALKAREAGYAEVSRKVGAIEHIRQRISDKDAAIADIARMEKSVEGRTKRVEELATLKHVMEDFKQNVTERISPTLSEISSDLFVTMTDSKYGGIEIDDNYDMEIYDGGEKYPVSRFSGGEGDLANLCLRLAISRVLADRSGNDINILILDEIFGSQDQMRKRAIMSTLNHLEKQFHQIILISHIDDTKDLMSNVITIKELDDGTSTVVA